MTTGRKKLNKADLLAGILVILVSVGLMAAVIFALGSLEDHLPGDPTTLPPATTTLPDAPPEPPPTLIPNPYEKGDFAYDANGYLSCLAGESWLGVDVSEHQGKIDWTRVAATDVRFAMVRLAYRGWGAEGVIRPDARGLENLDGAATAGLQVGVYFFSQAITVEEAREEARFLLQMLDGRALDLPIVYDWETVSSEDARTRDMDPKTLNACALAFCREVEAAGYEAMVYFNLDLAKRMFDLQAIQGAGYDFWLALYADGLGYAHRGRMWQYTSSGSVAGIKGNVDLNLYFPHGDVTFTWQTD